MNKKYEVIKVLANGSEINYGPGYSENDVKAITKGYKFNGLFYDRKNSSSFFMVNEI